MRLAWRCSTQLKGTSKKLARWLMWVNNPPCALLFSALVLVFSGCDAKDLTNSSTSISAPAITNSSDSHQPSSSTSSAMVYSSSSQSLNVEQPKAFNIPDIYYATAGVELLFDPIVIGGVQDTIEIYSDLGEISIDNGAYIKAPQTISNGQQFRLKVTAPEQSDSEIIATLTAGSYSTQHAIRTIEDDLIDEPSKRDSDGDGTPDIVDHAPNNADYQYTFEWVSPSLGYIRHPIDEGSTVAVAEDFNQDGLIDIAQVRYIGDGKDELQWAQGLGQGTFSEFKTLSSLDGYHLSQHRAELRLKVITHNPTGKPQLIVLGPQAALWEMVANQWQSTPLAPFASGVTQVRGQLFSFYDHTLSTPLASNSPDCHFNDNPSGHPHLESANFYGNRDFIVAFDFAFPLLLGSVENGNIECFTNNLDYYEYYEALLRVDFYSRQYVVSDIDNDGDEELIVSHQGRAGQHPTGLSIIDMEPGKNFYEQAILGRHSLNNARTRLTSVGVSDKDNDGDDDIIGVQQRTLNNESKPTIVVFENLGDRRFASNYIPLDKAIDYSNHLSLVDINNDGLVDIFTGSHWLEQQPDVIRYTHVYNSALIDLGAMGNDITYQLQNAPSGISINADTGLLSVSAQELARTIDLRLSASDGVTTRHRLIRIIATDSDDIDGDGVIDSEDLYPHNRAESGDFDGDGLPDNADNDTDNDSVPNPLDIDDFNPNIHTALSWPNLSNSFQKDSSAILEADDWVRQAGDTAKAASAQVIRIAEAFHLFDPANGQGDATFLYQAKDGCSTGGNNFQSAGQLFFIEYCGTIHESTSDLVQVSLDSKKVSYISWPMDSPAWTGLTSYIDPTSNQNFLILFQIDQGNGEGESTDSQGKINISSANIDDLTMHNEASPSNVIFNQYNIKPSASGLDLSNIYTSDVMLSDINQDGNFDVIIRTLNGNYTFINEGNTFTYKYIDALADVRVLPLSGTHNYQRFTINSLEGRFFVSGDLTSNYSLIPVPNTANGLVNYSPSNMVDYNQDGVSDYIASGGLFQNTYSDAILVTQSTKNRSLSIQALRDFNNDGVMDLIVRNHGSFNAFIDTLYLQVPQKTFEATVDTGLSETLSAQIVDQQMASYQVNTPLDSQYFNIKTGELSFYVTSTEHNQRLADGGSNTYYAYITVKSEFSQATQLVAVTVSAVN